jgi:hypothetical protein
MSTGEATGAGAPSEEELRATYEAELKKLRVEHVLLDNVVALINLGMRRTGLAPGTEEERDPAQVRLAIESIRGLMPVLEQAAPQQAGQIRAALSQLQVAFVKIGGGPGGPGGGPGGPGGPSRDPSGAPAEPGSADRPGSEQPRPGGPGPAQRSGRLWVPGQ